MKGLFFDIIYQTIGLISLPFPAKWKYRHSGLRCPNHSRCTRSSTIWQKEKGTACADTQMATRSTQSDDTRQRLCTHSLVSNPIWICFLKNGERVSNSPVWPWIYFMARMTLNSLFSYVLLTSVGITWVYHHTQFMHCWELDTGLCAH